MPFSVKQFIQELADSGLMSDADIQALRETPRALIDSAEDLTRSLVEGGRLTRFQAEALLKGEGRTLVLGNYTVLERIGAGGMGVVLKALHRRMEREVALKILPTSATDSEESIRRFHREVKAAAKLNHPNIVTAHDADEADGTHFYVMEYVEGSDLSSLVRRSGTLPVEAAIDCILQAAQGLEYAHRKGIVHRDIKPSNILLDRDGVVKILDMGLARIDAADLEEEQTELTGTGQIMGTIDYMAPEQALDTKHADARADIYSLGATLNFLLTGRPMLPGDTRGRKMQALLSPSLEQSASLHAYRDDVADELERVFQKMVARDPEQRYQSMAEVITDLQPLLPARESDSAARPSVADSATQPFGGVEELSSNDPALKRFLDAQDLQTTAVAQPPEIEVSAETVNSPAAEATQVSPATKTQQSTRSAARRSASRARLWTVLSLVLVGVVIAAGVIFRIKTRDGVLLIEIPQAVADEVTVEVDGERAEITGRDGKTISVEVAPGRHERLLVIVDGVRLLTDSDSGFEIDAGGELPIVARFIPEEPRAPGSGLPDGGNFGLQFDGDSSAVYADSFHYDGSHPITLEAWCVPYSADGQRGVVHSGGPFVMMRGGGRWQAVAYPESGHLVSRLADKAIDDGERVHVAAVYDGRSMQLFVDGVSQTDEPLNRYIDGNASLFDEELHLSDLFQSARLTIGNFSREAIERPGFHGVIDEVRISSIARYSEDFTPEQRFEPDEDTLALYHFDEGVGVTLVDSSGNGHDGEIVGALWVRVPNYEYEREVAEWVLRIGGDLHLHTEGSRSDWAQGFSPGDSLPTTNFTLSHVLLSEHQQVSNDDLQRLIGLSDLRQLRLDRTQIDDDGLRHVAQCLSLDMLYLSESNVTAAGLALLHDLPLKRLTIQFIDLNQEALDHISQIETLEMLDISRNNLAPLDLSVLSRIPGLSNLGIYGNSIGDDDLLELETLSNLKSLHLGNARITDDGLEILARLRTLETLKLGGTLISDAGVDVLSRMTGLVELQLEETDVTADGIARLLEALPNCRIIHESISDPDREVAEWVLERGGTVQLLVDGAYYQLPDDDLARMENRPSYLNRIDLLAAAPFNVYTAQLGRDHRVDGEYLRKLGTLTNLEYLTFLRNSVDRDDVHHLYDLTRLKYLNLGGCEWVDDDVVGELTQALPDLIALGLSSTSISNVSLNELRHLTALESCYLHHTAITGEGLSFLPNESLRVLRVDSTGLTDDDVPVLETFKQLEQLNVSDTQITVAGAARLQDSLPNCRIFHESISDPDREVAEWVLEQGGRVVVRVVEEPFTTKVERLVDVPEQAFEIVSVHFESVEVLDIPEALRVLESLKRLRHLVFSQVPLVDAHVAQIVERFPDLQTLSLAHSEITDEALVHISRHENLLSLSLYGTSVTAQHLPLLTTELDLQNLGLSRTQISGRDLSPIGSIRTLETLELEGLPITDGDLAPLLDLKLTRLFLSGTQITDESVPVLKTITTLQELVIRNTEITEDGIARLQEALPNCRIIHESISDPDREVAEWVLGQGGVLNVRVTAETVATRVEAPGELPDQDFAIVSIMFTEGQDLIIRETFDRLEPLQQLEHLRLQHAPVNDDDVADLIDRFPQLRTLSLAHTGITDDSVESISRHPGLLTLDLYGTAVTGRNLSLLASLDGLESLTLSDTQIAAEELAPLASIPTLKQLALDFVPVTDGDLAILAEIPLTRLLLGASQVTDASVPVLSQIPTLKTLNLRATDVTSDGVARLQEALPNCRIIHESISDPDRQVSEWVLEQGGTVAVFAQDSPAREPVAAPVVSSDDLPEFDFFVRTVNLNELPGLVGFYWEKLGELTRLNNLILSGTDVREEQMAFVAGCPHLLLLDLGNARITDESIAPLAGHSTLSSFKLGGPSESRLTAEVLQTITTFPNLVVLHLRYVEIDDDALLRLEPLADQLVELRLDYTALTDGAVDHLISFRNLKSLVVTNTGITGDGVARLQEALPDCEIIWDGGVVGPINYGNEREIAEWVLSLGGKVMISSSELSNHEVTEVPLPDGEFTVSLIDVSKDDQFRDLERLAPLRALGSLWLSGTAIEGDDLQHLARHQRLRTLKLPETDVGDEDLEYLSVLVNLRTLDLNGTQVTEEGVGALHEKLPTCHINWDGGTLGPEEEREGTKEP